MGLPVSRKTELINRKNFPFQNNRKKLTVSRSKRAKIPPLVILALTSSRPSFNIGTLFPKHYFFDDEDVWNITLCNFCLQ